MDSLVGARPEAALPKSTNSTICQAIVAADDSWCRRDLTNVVLHHLLLDASHVKRHERQQAEPILTARPHPMPAHWRT
ncbi:hypothetical protein [Nonomuraea ceibae]|uniref:hypothetical protein n=1 Tax=Nonomuraea ceibae TaxID=1935170 RepID=UPI001C5FBCAC|nr:hypothetical protein [Nonomuraea ceibae]